MDIKKVIAKYPRIHLTPLPTPLEFAPQLTKISRRNWKIRRSKEYVQSRARLQKVIAREESILILCH